MTIMINKIEKTVTVDEIGQMLKIKTNINLNSQNKKEKYQLIKSLLDQVNYSQCNKKDKGAVIRFINRITNYSITQTKRLTQKYNKNELVWQKWQRNTFSCRYRATDIALLHEVDSLHRLSGPATKIILYREYHTFNKQQFKNLANISVAHIYNLRKTRIYRSKGSIKFTKTNESISSEVKISYKYHPSDNSTH